MRTMFALVALPCAVLSYTLSSSADEVARAAFAAYKTQYGKVYGSEMEESRRFDAFKASLDRVGKRSTAGLTRFSDLTPEEFKAQYLTRQQGGPETDKRWDGRCTACKRYPELANLNSTASGFDWTTRGAVTAVKDQAQCGSCWAFGTTGDLEGTWFLAGHHLASLSEEEIVSCDTGGAGCGGGLQEQAFAWIIKNGGLAAEKRYPYTAGGGQAAPCQEAKTKPVVASISSWYQVSKTAAGEAHMAEQLPKVGPITIGIDAGPMQDYKGGIDNPECGTMLDHAVLVVGFGTENGVDYWKIKNSWGTSWGEDGYYRIVKGQNKCGLALDAVHSVV